MTDSAPSVSEPIHLNHHNRDTLDHIFQHPLSHNIDWKAVVTLLTAVGTVNETQHGSILVALGGQTETFENSRHKDLEVQQVVDLRRMLKSAGYGPTNGNEAPEEGKEPAEPSAG